MPDFETMRLPAVPTEVAPDGSDVRVLLKLVAGGLAHFELGPGQVSAATRHRTVEEIWYFEGCPEWQGDSQLDLGHRLGG